VLNVGDKVTVRKQGTYLRQMHASPDWQDAPKVFIEGGSEGSVVGFTASVVGEPRYVVVNFCGTIGHVAETSLVTSSVYTGGL